jgi:hypothetical protein
MVASYVRERERIFLRWLENVERLLNQQVNRDAAYKAWRDGYSVREYAGEATAPSPLAGKREAEEGWAGRAYGAHDSRNRRPSPPGAGGG